MTERAEPSRRYRFAPRVRRGALARLPPAGAALALSSVAGALALARTAPGHGGLLAAAALLVAGVALASLRVGGRFLVEWCGAFGRFAGRLALGRHRLGWRQVPGGMASRAAGVFADLVLGELEGPGAPVGVVLDARERTLSAALSVVGAGLGLADDEDRVLAADAWSGALAALGEDRSICAVKWLHLCAPDSADRFRARLAEALSSVEPPPERSQAAQSYEELCAQLEVGARRTETLVVVSTRAQRRPVARTPSASGTALGDLAEAVRAAERQLVAAGLSVTGVLTRAGLASATERLFSGVARPGAHPSPFPEAIEERWECLRTEGSWHATYWIAEWPRTEVPACFLTPLLLQGPPRVAVAVALAPVRPERALKVAERRRTSSFASADLRRRYGFQTSARLRAEHEATLREEDELAVGHAAFAFSGYVTVGADSAKALERACEEMERCAARSRVGVRRLFGMQAHAIAYALVNGRGCG